MLQAMSTTKRNDTNQAMIDAAKKMPGVPRIPDVDESMSNGFDTPDQRRPLGEPKNR